MHDAYGTDESKQKTGSKMRERLLKGLGAQGFSQAVQIFIRLAEVPLLLSFWGTQLYGEWLMLSALPIYLSISDGGFAGPACREMTMRSGEGEKNRILGSISKYLGFADRGFHCYSDSGDRFSGVHSGEGLARFFDHERR